MKLGRHASVTLFMHRNLSRWRLSPLHQAFKPNRSEILKTSHQSCLMVVEEICLLSCQTKDELAHAIMTAIRKHLGRQQHSALEKAILQLVS